MQSISRNKAITASVTLRLTLTATPAAAQSHKPSRSVAEGSEIAAVSDCDGGAQIGGLVRTKSSPVTIGENSFFAVVPNTLRIFTIEVAEDTDQVRNAFFVEAALFGAPVDNSGAADALGLEIQLDGVALPAPGDLAFATTPLHVNATMVCRRIGWGTHTLEAYWRVRDSGQAITVVLLVELSNGPVGFRVGPNFLAPMYLLSRSARLGDVHMHRRSSTGFTDGLAAHLAEKVVDFAQGVPKVYAPDETGRCRTYGSVGLETVFCDALTGYRSRVITQRSINGCGVFQPAWAVVVLCREGRPA